MLRNNPEDKHTLSPEVREKYIEIARSRLRSTFIDAKENYDRLIKLPDDKIGSICLSVVELRKANHLTQKNFILLFDRIEYCEKVHMGLTTLNETNILTEENITFITQHAEYAENLARGLLILHKKITLDTTANRNILAMFPSYANYIAACILRLDVGKLLNQMNINYLIKNVVYSQSIALGIRDLNEANLLTQNNYNLLIRHAKHADDFALSLRSINGAFGASKIATHANYYTLIRYRDFSKEIAEKLDRTNIEINQTVFDAIIREIAIQINAPRIAFHMGDDPILGYDSSIRFFSRNPDLSEKYLSEEIFSFLPSRRNI